jgi:amino acid adenylation domain-containing protein
MNFQHIDNMYPLSPMQHGMMFHSLYDPEAAIYYEQSTWTLHGKIDMAAFKRAWEKVIERHAALRTSFLWEGLEEPLQIVHKKVKLPFVFYDWQDFDAVEQKRKISDLLKKYQQEGFDLITPPLMRIVIVRVAPETYQFIWNHHHLLLDGWSYPLILQEVLLYYQSYKNGEDLYLPEVKSYSDYIAWLINQDKAAAKDFWSQYLKDYEEPFSLIDSLAIIPTPSFADFGDDDEQDYDIVNHLLPIQISNQVRYFAKEHGVTLNTVIQAALGILLYRYSGRDDVVFGATVSGRPVELPGVESIVGLFINTVPVWLNIDEGKSIGEWIKNVQVEQYKIRQFEYSALPEIQQWSGHSAEVPLFDVLYVFENYPFDVVEESFTDEIMIKTGDHFSRTNYPLTVAVSPGNQIGLTLAYNQKIISAKFIRRMFTHFQNILETIVKHPEMLIKDIDFLTQREKYKLLNEWTDTFYDHPQEMPVFRLFEYWGDQMPDALAVKDQYHALNYGPLNAKANQIARYILDQRVGADDLVAICVERSIELILAQLAVMKSGAAFVNIDPTLPQERIDFIIQDANVSVVLTKYAYADYFDHESKKTILLDQEGQAFLDYPETNPDVSIDMKQLAYAVYTSGSTGAPKGVLLEHASFANLIFWTQKEFCLSPFDRASAILGIGFDASVWEIWAPLSSGAALLIPSEAVREDPVELKRWVEANYITSFVSSTPVAEAMLQMDWSRNYDLRLFHVGGDRLKMFTPKEVNFELVNHYGPTEATVSTTCLRVPNNAGGDAYPSIGFPIDNVQVYILDDHLRLVPIGVAGDLYIGGESLARSYLNFSELSAERFIPNPFSDFSGERLYKTGDIARFKENGEVYFIGRKDGQVKIRGYRIELGEIEVALKQMKEIADVAVVVHEFDNNQRQLVAYIVNENGQVEIDQIKNRLLERLPDYMVPAFFVRMEHLPLTRNGKIDRKALPKPSFESFYGAQSLLAVPRTPIENGLADIWQQVLGRKRIGIHENFYDIGGHSLTATQIVSRAREAFQVEIPLREMFESPTIAGQSVVIGKLMRQSAGLDLPPIKPAEPSLHSPLSFAQSRLWFLDQLAPEANFYNIPLAFVLEGELDIILLETSLNEIVKRHSILRTYFDDVGGVPVQVVENTLPVRLEIEDLSEIPDKEKEERINASLRLTIRQPFDLSTAPLFRTKLIKTGAQGYIALLVMHHIITDGWSKGIILSELVSIYEALQQGQPSSLKPLKIQYRDYAVWQKEIIDNGALQPQIAYWQNQLAGSTPMLDMPLDYPRPSVQTSNGDTYTFEISETVSDGLKLLSQEEESTLYMVMMAAFQVLLKRYSGQDDINVGTVIANRNRSEIEQLIGFFVNTLVIRGDLSENISFREFLAQIRRKSLGAYANQDVPFEMLVDILQPERDLSHTPLFQVMFLLNNFNDQQITLSDLIVHPYQISSGSSVFDLSMAINDQIQGLNGYVEYNTDLYKSETIEQLVRHYLVVLAAVIENPDLNIDQIPILTAEEKHNILVEWNQTTTSYPDQDCAHELVEQQAINHPQTSAILFEDHVLTYSQLDQKANQLAWYLRGKQVGKNDIIGISMERSPEMIIAILGTMKSGAAYLPLDPSYPQDRLAFMMSDADISVLITKSQLLDWLPAYSSDLICMDQDWEKIAAHPAEKPPVDVGPEDLAYVIYTSGSTGNPKGALLNHRGLCNLTAVQKEAFQIDTASRVLQFSPYSFDASVWEIFMALANGGTLCLAPQEILASAPDLVKLLREQRISNITIPPSILRSLPETALPDLQTVIAAGEACTEDLVRRWSSGRQFFNAYGPTETTVCASMYLCRGDERGNPPIGKPINNTQLYVLDKGLNPVPVGINGELYIGGVSLARGYLNREDMTSEKFIPNPFSQDSNSRLYKTGDLVRFLEDGNIEFIGRVDHQVKLRGFRIELGEVEANLEKRPEIKQAVALVKQNLSGNQFLTAYLLLEQNHDISVPQIRDQLRQKLPDYMIPSYFIVVDEFHRTPSGKLDLKALPDLDGSRPDIGQEYVEPRNYLEEQLVKICQDLLQIEQVGVYDNFFELGGHSLLATQYISRVRDIMGIEVPLRILFEHPTIAGFGEQIEKDALVKQSVNEPEIIPISRERRRVKASDVLDDFDR